MVFLIKFGKTVFLSLFAASFLLCAPLWQPAAGAASAQKDILAVAGKNIVVTRQDLEAAVARYKAQSGKEQLTKAETAGLLQDILRRRLLLQLPAVKACKKDPAVIAAVKDFEDTQIVARWVEKNMRAKAQVSEQEVRAYYDKHRQEFRIPPSVKASYILLRTKGEAEMVQQKLRAGANFAQLAKQYSIDLPTGQHGGLIGSISEGKTPTALGRMLFLLAPGETSEIVTTKAGYAIFRADAITPPAFKPYADVSEGIREALLQTKARNTLKQIVEGIEKKAGMKIYKARLAAVEHAFAPTGTETAQKTAQK